jgi:hypothetical protein
MVLVATLRASVAFRAAWVEEDTAGQKRKLTRAHMLEQDGFSSAPVSSETPAKRAEAASSPRVGLPILEQVDEKICSGRGTTSPLAWGVEFELKGIRRPLAAYNVVTALAPKV